MTKSHKEMRAGKIAKLLEKYKRRRGKRLDKEGGFGGVVFGEGKEKKKEEKEDGY